MSRGRTSLFYASIATFAPCREFLLVLRYEISWTDYFPVGLLAAGCFSVALVTNRLARGSIGNEALVRQRSADLRHQIEVNRPVIRDITGPAVLVVDADDIVRLANPEAERLLGRAGLQGNRLADPRACAEPGGEWRDARGIARQHSPGSRGMRSNAAARTGGRNGRRNLMFLEDSGKLRLQAQQAKRRARSPGPPTSP